MGSIPTAGIDLLRFSAGRWKLRLLRLAAQVVDVRNGTIPILCHIVAEMVRPIANSGRAVLCCASEYPQIAPKSGTNWQVLPALCAISCATFGRVTSKIGVDFHELAASRFAGSERLLVDTTGRYRRRQVRSECVGHRKRVDGRSKGFIRTSRLSRSHRIFAIHRRHVQRLHKGAKDCRLGACAILTTFVQSLNGVSA